MPEFKEIIHNNWNIWLREQNIYIHANNQLQVFSKMVYNFNVILYLNEYS